MKNIHNKLPLSHKETYDIINYICNNIDFDIFTEQEKHNLLRTPLFEQAYTRDKFVFMIENLSEQIIQNLCLILYAKYYNKNLYKYVNHWKIELRSYCIKIANTSLKNCSTANRKKVINYAFFEQSGLSNDEVIFELISKKFNKEGINVYDETYAIYDVIEEAITILKDDIVPMMCLKDTEAEDKIINYIAEDL